MKISGLSKRFGKKVIFDNFSLELPSRGITALSGESGCGKTTLLRIIAGLDKKYSGTVDYGNIKKISYVFQEPRLLPHSTVLENVALSLGNTEEAKEVAKKLLTEVGLENDLDSYPDQLSGGMKMRVSIARALAYNGDILLLDEAFNGIDEERTKSIMKLISDYAKNKPCILISHNKEHLEYLQCNIIYL